MQKNPRPEKGEKHGGENSKIINHDNREPGQLKLE